MVSSLKAVTCHPSVLPMGATAPGMLAWGTSLHALPSSAGVPPGTYGVAETPFLTATPNEAELRRMTQLCAFITANGSGYGICKACQFTGSPKPLPTQATLACPAPTGLPGTPYNSTLVGLGGVPPYTYSIAAGALPMGLTLNPTTGAITGIPLSGGVSNFTAKLTDDTGLGIGMATANCSISLTPNQAPSFTKGADQTAPEDSGAQTIAGWATAISPGPGEGFQTVSFNITGNTNAALFSVAPSISPTGTLTFTPALNQVGTATITVVIMDNGGTSGGGVDTSAPQTFDITVSPVNDAPSFTKGPNQTVLEDAGPQTVNAWATAISPGPPNEAGQTMSFNITGNTNPGLFSAGPSVSSTGVLTYTPAPNANGSATVTLNIMDNGGTANGGVDTSAPQTFDINVTPVNDAPSFTKGLDQNTVTNAPAQSIANWATAISPGPANESGQTVAFNITGNTNAGLFSVAPAVSAAGTLTYTLAANMNGTATITLVAMDNGGTANGGVDTSAPQSFIINVAPPNQAPSFTKGLDQTVLEDAGPQTVNPWATAISPGPPAESGQTVTFNITGNTNSGLFSAGPAVSPTGVLTYTPAANQNGTATITLVIMDNGGTAGGGVDTSAPQSFVINVTAVNDTPSFTKGTDQTVLEDAGPQTVTGWATAIAAGPANEAGQTVNFNITGNTNPGLFSAGPLVAADGTLTYTPAANTSGTATITLNAMDNGGTLSGGIDTSAPQTFIINVTNINDAPSFTKGTDPTVLEDAGPQSIAGWATAISPGPPSEAGQLVNFNITGNTNAALFSAGPVVSPTGTLTFTPAPNAHGSATITLNIMDNGGTANGGIDTSAPQSFVITVTPVNDAPSFTKGVDQTVLEDTGAHTVTGWATAISPGPADESAQTVAFNITGNTNAAMFSVAPAVSPAGDLTYTLAANAFGTASITLVAMDNGGTASGGVDTSTPQTFVINVTNVNDAPSFTKGADPTVLEDAGPQSIAGWATAISAGPNEGGQTVTFNITGNTNAALFSSGPTVTSAGTLTFTTAANANGSATITLNIMDNGGTANGGVDTSGSQTFIINVTPVNDAPAVTAKTFVVQPNIQILVGAPGLLTGTTDPNDPENLTPAFTVTAASVASGTLTFLADGSFTYDPAPGNTSDVTLNYTVCDNGTPGSACTNATATLDLAGPVIWFINNNAAACTTLAANCGRLNNPFSTLAAFNALNDGVGNNPNNNHNIFVYESGTAYTGAVTMRTGQKLIGQDATASLATIVGAAPPINSIGLPAMNSGNATVSNITSTVTLNTNATVRGLRINSTTSTGMNDPGGAITGVSVSEVGIATTTGTAVSLSNLGGTISLTSVSANGGANGIILTNTTGSFTVTGDGTNTAVGGNSSGGTISNMTGGDTASQLTPFSGVGVYLNNAQNVALRRMTINGTNQNYAIRGFSVNGFALEYSTVSGTNGTTTSLAAPETFGEGSIFFGNTSDTGVVGAVTFTNNLISGGAARNLSIFNTVAGTTTLTVKGNTFGAMQNLTGGNQSFAVEARVSSGVVINSIVGGTGPGEGNTFTSAVSDLVNFTGQQQTTMDVEFRNNVLSNNNAGNVIGGGSLVLASAGTMTYHVTGNTMRDAHGSAVTLFKAGATLGTPSMSGFFDSNTIGVAAVTDSGSKSANGIFVSAGGTGTMSHTITNNTIHQIRGNGHIYADNTGGSYTANFTIAGNTLDTPGAGWFAGIAVSNGSPMSADTINVCAKIGGGTPAEKNTLNLAGALGVIVGSSGANGGHTFNLPGYAGGASLPNVEAFLAANNAGAFTTDAYADAPATPAAFTGVGTTCPTPTN